MISNTSFTITTEDLPLARLDKILIAHYPTSTRGYITSAISSQTILVDGIARPKAFKPPLGSTITIVAINEQSDRGVTPTEGFLNCVWEDSDLLAFNKPGGQPCQPIQPSETTTLANAITFRYPDTLGVGEDPMLPGMLHRIDSGTSGLVLCARNQAAYVNIRKQFADRTVKKIYTAIVHGEVRKVGGISGFLAHNSSFRGKMRCVSGNKLPDGERPMFAETFYKPIHFANGKTTLEVTIYTGVTHQIRCQLASIGFPIVGDITYGSTEPLTHDAGDYHLLHATSAELTHPSTGKRVTLHTKPRFLEYKDM